MTDRYEMPHPRADECRHAGVGKACRPCRDRFVVPEAAVERAARAMQAENAPKPDPLNRDQREEQDDATIATYRTLARAEIERAALSSTTLTAAPSATREEVARAIRSVTDRWDEPLDEVHDVPPVADALLARFNITPKEDR